MRDAIEIPLFGFVETLDDEDAIAIEVITFCQAATAIYYISKARGEKAAEYLDFSIFALNCPPYF